MKFGRKFHQALDTFLFAVGVVTVILGVNEATVDALDHTGSNYWFAWCATISGTATLLLILRGSSSWKIGARKKDPMRISPQNPRLNDKEVS